MDPRIKVLALPVPPKFETVMGYFGDQKWVAFYWDLEGDQPVSDDGCQSEVIDWTGWFEFTRHALVRLAIKGWDLGSHDRKAPHWLLLDREEQTFYIGPEKEVSDFLFSVTGQRSAPPDRIPPERLRALVERIVNDIKEGRVNISQEEMETAVFKRMTRCAEMVDWLNRRRPEITAKKDNQ